ncbi:MAG: hypothetical protein DRQ41_15195 [Gammaproteobacteria bacterium]|nr:MAG: hypothetical protein DRQ41_15195 [Gammaproteobacteria bacterium]
MQNALDVEHELYGYDGIQVKVYVDKLGTHVIDRGKGITWRAFLIGRSEKPEWVRGRFGEGLDLATLVFGIRGYNCYFFTKNIVFRTLYDKKNDIFLIVMGQSKIYVDGTHVLTHKWKLPKDIIRLIYWKNNPSLKLLNVVYYSPREGLPKMPNMVFKDEEKKKKLYVRDIFVNYDENIVQNPFYFTYNLWWVELDPNRTNVYRVYELSNNVKNTLLQSPEPFFEFIQKHLEQKSYGGMTYYTLEELTKFYEGGLDYDGVIRRLRGKKPFEELMVKLKDLLKSKHISAVTHLHDYDAIPVVAHEGGTVILVPRLMVEMFNIILPKAHDFVSESVKKTIGESKVLEDDLLTLPTLIKFGKFRLLADYLNIKYIYDKDLFIKVIPIKGRSHATVGRVYVDIDEPGEVFVHEIAHALGFALYGDAPDVSENFERCLEKVAVGAMEMATSYKYSVLLRRIENGCVYARHEHIPLSGRYKEITYYGLRKDNDYNPSILLVGLEKGDKLMVVALDFRMENVVRGVPDIFPEPFLKSYYEIVNPLAKLGVDMLSRLIRYEGEKPSDAVKDLLEEFERRHPRIDFLAYDLADRIIYFLTELKTFGGNRVVAFIYDIKRDEYVLKAEAGLMFV